MELYLNEWIQENLAAAEPMWVFLSDYLTPTIIINVLTPLVGIFNQKLLVRLICTLGIMNGISSLMKWIYPEDRPFWFINELALNKGHFKQFPQTCETTGGLPSNHSMAFTAFTYMLVFSSMQTISRRYNLNESKLQNMAIPSLFVATTLMWISRLYLNAQFLHQCVYGSLMAIILIHIFKLSSGMYKYFSKTLAIPIVLIYGLIPVAVYFIKLQRDMDPHWSVRMAFKWCTDPSFLRHDTAPIYLLARDSGYLMGIALALPLPHNSPIISLRKRVPIFTVLVIINFYAKCSTLKQHGRLVFLAYEFLRNLIHTFVLLKIMPKIA